MVTKRTGAAFSVRFLRNGDKIEFDRIIKKENGQGTSLFQIIDTTSGDVSPNWATNASERPIISLSPRTAAGFGVAVNSVIWKINGQALAFTYEGDTWVWASGSSSSGYMARIHEGNYELKICKNLATTTDLTAKTIEYEVNYTSGNITETFRDSVECPVYIVGSNSHIVQIAVDAVNSAHTAGGITLGNHEYWNGTAWVSTIISQTTLRTTCYYGTSAVTIGSGGYTMQWYQDGVAIPGATASTLTVTRAMVEGGSIFIAKLMKDGNVVGQDGQRINDNADEWQVDASPASAGSNCVSVVKNADGSYTQKNAVYNLVLMRNGNTATGITATFTSQIFDALGLLKATVTGATVTITPAHCLLNKSDSIDVGSPDAIYDDVDVQVTAEFSD